MSNDRQSDIMYDLNRILVRPLYYGMVTNVLVPVAILFVCWYYDNNYGRGNLVGDGDKTLFILLAVLALGHAVLCFWWYRRRLEVRIVTAADSVENDLAAGLLQRIRPVLLATAAISLYGYLYYVLTGYFRGAVVFVLVSFITFQLLRPRHGSLRRLIARQLELLKTTADTSPPNLPGKS